LDDLEGESKYSFRKEPAQVQSGRPNQYRLNRRAMNDKQQANPFKVGDSVIFAPNDHAIGWSWSSFDRLRLHPGDTGIVTRVDKEMYLYLDDDRGGFHWECFKLAS
jgi:hypothetical protein